MDVLDSVIGKLSGMEHVVSVHVPSESELGFFLEMEAGIVPDSGMPMRNDSLLECRKREMHLIVVQDTESFDRVPHHAMTWENDAGKVIAFDVPDDLRFEIEGRDDLFWISDDFVMLPIAEDDKATLVFHPTPVKCIGEAEGVRDAILLYPAPPVDHAIRERFGIRHTGEYATAVLSFNLL